MTDSPEFRAWADRAHADSLRKPKGDYMKFWCEHPECTFVCRGKSGKEMHERRTGHRMYRARRRKR